MDKKKALQLQTKLKDQSFFGYNIIELINNGKSAAVFKAEKEGKGYALKIFDNNLIERFGHEIQSKRIEQEISLKNHSIPNLVKIYEGGNTLIGNETYYFLVMELIDGLNLKQVIDHKDYKISLKFIKTVFERLYKVSEALLSKFAIVHRDIKPENIMKTDSGKIILMDLGVLKFIGSESFSDQDEKAFVGTLRYAPPEFLLRKEENTIDGWRAVNYYQIGATLHDLIMEKELFIEKSPYTNLVLAIKEDFPNLSNNDLPFELLQFTRDLLTKNPNQRLELITKNRIDTIRNLSNADTKVDKSVQQILHKRINHQNKFAEIDKIKRTKEENRKRQEDLGKEIKTIIDGCFKDLKERQLFNNYNVSNNFNFDGDSSKENYTQNYLYELEGELEMGFPTNLYYFLRIENSANGFAKIDAIAFFPSFMSKGKIENALEFVREVFERPVPLSEIINRVGPRPIKLDFKTITFFKGVISNDTSTKEFIIEKIVEVMAKAFDLGEPFVDDVLEANKKHAEAKGKGISIRLKGRGNLIVDSL
ncbi:protein kinase [Zunongwangia sp. F363]|uniref:Protein kinase n=1 Tax=Autumnicola tepida TaxID=3075595 RepID=A0ABU3CF21_9FLAO|nr:protein kinase [Zunongwangia sp. F363]MDT0644948.1 protein kinase [Zunongwangia sp. F363]